jgi:hypothetical protein
MLPEQLMGDRGAEGATAVGERVAVEGGLDAGGGVGVGDGLVAVVPGPSVVSPVLAGDPVDEEAEDLDFDAGGFLDPFLGKFRSGVHYITL